jgi:hypothetical protein
MLITVKRETEKNKFWNIFNKDAKKIHPVTCQLQIY